MDDCCFPRVKAARPPRKASSSSPGLSSKHTRKNVIESSSSSNKVSATSVPLTPRSKGEILSDMKSFTFNDLKTATRNFRPSSVLGEGGFGLVFKGWIDEQTFAPARPGTGLVIAVKKLNQEGLQGHKEWLAEINYLGQFHHPNLVKLIGYCLEDEQRLLVYEFMKLGSLENHLFRSNSDFKPLSWNLRMKVALGAARGLAFLHSGPTKVIYRDFKASNVLLDSDYNAKLSDFGLAKNGPVGDESHVSTRIMGTHGYAAPEYLATGHLTVRSDVYSFGVVLLEILTGRHALDNDRPSRERSLVKWAMPALASKQTVLKILDARLDGKFSVEGAHRAAEVARQCLLEAKYRPTMEEVVKVLGELQDAKDIVRRPQNRQRGSGQSSENHGSSGDGKVASTRPPASPL